MDLLLSTWPDVEAHLSGARGALVPVGSIEQHGPHGLIGTDAICAEAIARRLADEKDVLVCPTIAFGVAPFNLGFAGTISFRASTLMAIVADYVHSLMRHGVDRIYFLNGHGGNIGPLRAAAQEILSDHGYDPGLKGKAPRFRFRNWWEYPDVDALRRALYAEGEGMHATPSEIAITQALHPERAKLSEIAAPARLSPAFLREHAGDNHAAAAEHRRAFPDGRVGSDSALARPEHGARLLAAAAANALTDFRAFMAEP